MSSPQSAVVEVPLDALKSHPMQATLFGPPDQALVESIADDVAANGLRQPIHVLPDGVILAGHTRAAAFVLLGRTTIPAIVRYDLAADPLAAERFLVSDNFDRRQLSHLRQVIAIMSLVEADPQSPGLAPRDERTITAEVAKRLRGPDTTKLSAKSLGRYVAVARGPAIIITAYEAGMIRLTDAARIGRLPPDQKQRIADEVEAGGIAEARKVAARYFRSCRGDESAGTEPVYDALLVHVGRALECVGDRTVTVPDHSPARLADESRKLDRLGVVLSAARDAIADRLKASERGSSGHRVRGRGRR